MLVVYLESHGRSDLSFQIPWRFAGSVPGRELAISQIVARIPTALVSVLDLEVLGPTWQRSPAPASLQSLGDRWLAAATHAVLRVPSAVAPSGSNYLLNPDHPDFGEIQIGEPQPIDIDPRLASR